jgi:hypothetical protein
VFHGMLPLGQITGTGSLRSARRLRGVVAYADARLHYIYTTLYDLLPTTDKLETMNFDSKDHKHDSQQLVILVSKLDIRRSTHH